MYEEDSALSSKINNKKKNTSYSIRIRLEYAILFVIFEEHIRRFYSFFEYLRFKKIYML